MSELNYELNDILKKGFFTINHEHDQNYRATVGPTIFLNNGTIITLKEVILQMIQEAKSVIKLCSFILTDDEIVAEIIKKSKDPNVSIFFLTQLDKKKLTNKLTLSYDANDEDVFNTQEINSHLSNIKLIRDNGVHVRASKDLHAKFIITDRSRGLIMSANFTKNSMILNVESGALLNTIDSQDLDKLFDSIYLNGTSYRSFISVKKGKKMFVSETKSIMSKDQLPVPQSGLRYTYENFQNSLLNELINIIDNADDLIFLSTYSIVSLAKIPQIVDAISKARTKGVEISIFCRAMNYRHDHLEGCRILSNLGCNIFGDFYNHSKGIVSEKKAMIFTANIDGNFGLTNSFEVGFLLDEVQRLDFLKLHKDLIENCLFIFSNKPTRKDFMEFISLYEMKKKLSPFFNEIKIEVVVSKCLHDYFKDISDNLMFVGKNYENGKIIYFLNLDNLFFEIKISGSKLIVIKKCEPIYNTEKYFLKFTNLKITFIYE